VILTPVIGGLLVADLRRRRAGGDHAGAAAVGRAALGWLGIALASYVPLAIHEIGSDFSEVRAAVAFVTGGGGPASVALPTRFPIVGLRVLGWPLTGLLTAAPIVTILAAGLVIGLAVWRGWLREALTRRGANADPGLAAADLATGDDTERIAVRWLALGLTWTIIALAVGASSLATVVAGLPNDHYHAFADPMVVALVAVGLAGLIHRRPSTISIGSATTAPLAAGVAVLVALVGWNLATQPPARAPDGGWDAARTAAGRVVALGAGGPFVLSSLPTFKSDEAVRMPLEAAGGDVMPAGVNGAAFGGPESTLVILCDQLFRAAIGADCGGPAEDTWLIDPRSGLTAPAPSGRAPTLVTRFEAAPGRWISVYRAAP